MKNLQTLQDMIMVPTPHPLAMHRDTIVIPTPHQFVHERDTIVIPTPPQLAKERDTILNLLRSNHTLIQCVSHNKIVVDQTDHR